MDLITALRCSRALAAVLRRTDNPGIAACRSLDLAHPDRHQVEFFPEPFARFDEPGAAILCTVDDCHRLAVEIATAAGHQPAIDRSNRMFTFITSRQEDPA